MYNRLFKSGFGLLYVSSFVLAFFSKDLKN